MGINYFIKGEGVACANPFASSFKEESSGEEASTGIPFHNSSSMEVVRSEGEAWAKPGLVELYSFDSKACYCSGSYCL